MLAEACAPDRWEPKDSVAIIYVQRWGTHKIKGGCYRFKLLEES